ncbi:hypothetical protein XI04_03315 [Bradyrhizobium sp. CCBAU 11430]|nr:hypothetical protein [Bradyrhizobium sp. CCBAU 11430]
MRRIRSDRLVALAFPWTRRAHDGSLILEAVAEGWWYAPPHRGALGTLIFVTDSDLLPGDATQRICMLREVYGGSALMSKVGEAPDFSDYLGMDAQTGSVRDPVAGKLVAIGDAAISLDPLSGSGVQNAVEGAWTAATELADTQSIGPVYRHWLTVFRDRQLQMRYRQYEDAARRFRNSSFWQRRMEVAAESRL